MAEGSVQLLEKSPSLHIGGKKAAPVSHPNSLRKSPLLGTWTVLLEQYSSRSYIQHVCIVSKEQCLLRHQALQLQSSPRYCWRRQAICQPQLGAYQIQWRWTSSQSADWPCSRPQIYCECVTRIVAKAGPCSHLPPLLQLLQKQWILAILEWYNNTRTNPVFSLFRSQDDTTRPSLTPTTPTEAVAWGCAASFIQN